jgi:hypothetical protein
MPTTRPRHVITESDEVTQALDVAAKRWPEDRDRPAKLVLHLIREGCRAVGETTGQIATDRKKALRRTSGLLTGVYGPGYLDRLRRDWPE